MPTLSAMFRLMDGYSSQLDRLMNRMDEITDRLDRASNAADDFNDDLDRTGRASSNAAKGLKSFLSVAAATAASKKVMNMTDSYTNTAARLKMVNDGLQTQAELQDKVFAAANRSRGSYADMAAAVAKMNLLAGDSFGSNDEAIAFTELLQKSLKVSGAGTTEQQSAFLQLTQAMAAGKLQGDEFRSIMENAPMVAQAISDYMGVSKGELKELSSEGAITADIIKNAMFMAAEDINNKFAEMPMTFADVWIKIKNAGQRAFGGVFTKLNEALNSDGVQSAINNFIGLIYLAGDAVEGFIGFFTTAWPIISPFIWAVVVALGAYVAVQTVSNALSLISGIRTGAQAVYVGLLAVARWATTKATWAAVTAEMGLTEAQLGANAAMYACPIVWIIGIIIALIAVFYAAVAAVNHFAGTTYSATGFICGAFATAGAFIWNVFLGLADFLLGCVNSIANPWIEFANFFANVFNNPVSSIIYLFQGLADTILGLLEKIASGIDYVFGSNLAETVSGWRDNLKDLADAAVAKYAPDENYQRKYDSLDLGVDDLGLSRLAYGDAWDAGYEFGEGMGDMVSSLFSGFDDLGDWNEDEFATGSNPAVVEGTGTNGTMEVDMADEDIQYLRDLAQRDYVAKIATNTLAPNIRVEFTGPITESVNKETLGRVVGEIMQDEIASTAEGIY